MPYQMYDNPTSDSRTFGLAGDVPLILQGAGSREKGLTVTQRQRVNAMAAQRDEAGLPPLQPVGSAILSGRVFGLPLPLVLGVVGVAAYLIVSGKSRGGATW